MKLPGNSIGITDMLGYRDCAARMAYGMKRHIGEGKQSDAMTPEGGSPAAAYGSCLHDVVALTEEPMPDEQAIQAAWAKWGRWLEPGDLDRLRDDLATYRDRDYPNTRTVLCEDEIKVPLLMHDGERVWFRAKIDRLYERLDEPGTFIHVDYKTSKWPKNQADVDGDLQMWAYNWAIHEHLPEVETLVQTYDQLRYGQVQTRKSDDQRRQIRDWLRAEATAIIEDEDLEPTFNRWCAYCALIADCPVIPQLSGFAQAGIAALQGNADPIQEYVAGLDRARQARAALEAYETKVKGLLRDAPESVRLESGFTQRPRRTSNFSPAAKAVLAERLGDRFLDAATITKSRLESALADEPELLDWALGLAEKIDQPTLNRTAG